MVEHPHRFDFLHLGHQVLNAVAYFRQPRSRERLLLSANIASSKQNRWLKILDLTRKYNLRLPQLCV